MSKVAMITGAGKHLGRAFAIALSRQGYTVVATGQTQEELDELASKLEGNFLVKVCDITDSKACEAVVKATVEKFGSLDILVNNAGIYTEGSFAQTPGPTVQSVFNVVVTGTACMSRAALAFMAEQRSGQLIDILDVRVREGLPEFGSGGSHAVDTTAKFAKKILTDALRQEATQYNVVVTAFFMKWVASDIDIDDTKKAPHGATHPKDAATYLIKAIQEEHKETILPPSI